VKDKPPRIMIVEDEFLIAQELQKRLEALGYHVTAAVDSGEEALQLAGENPPQVVLMDIRLQGQMSGIETAAALQRERGIPCIYVTAHAAEPILEQAAATEHSGYLIKPYHDKELQAAIKAALFRIGAHHDEHGVEEPCSSLDDLSEIVTVCSECKKIKTRRGNWQVIERRVRDRSKASFSDSLCPDCVKRLYPDLWEKLRDQGHLD
jgi:CheY-like chemotaxis protein